VTKIYQAKKLLSGSLYAGLLIIFSAILFRAFNESDLLGHFIPMELANLVGKGGSIVYFVYFSLAKILVMAVPFVIVEILLDSAKRSQIGKLYLFPIFLWIASLFLSCSVIYLSVKIQKFLGITPLLSLTNIPYWLHVTVWIVAIDFFGYWFHRLEHSIPFLWQFHATHHAIKELNSINQYEHWFEGMFRFFLVTLPVSAFIVTPVLEYSIIALIYPVWVVYTHCDISQISLHKWLRRLFADNFYHRLHHGVEPGYYNKNFANMFSFWDWLFGTQIMPIGEVFPEAGLLYLRSPQNLAEYITHPFLPKFKVGKNSKYLI
jgi:sterol desaturase/sphingolipid hydroxylase (fatty acid hydroxylase superfamily)